MALGSAEKYAKNVDYNVEVSDYPEADLNDLYRSSGKFKDAKRA